MLTDQRATLAKIKRFDQLIAYLRDHMGWPIAGDDFEDLTFEYTPDELGIDAKNAAKIQEIKRLRPLSPRQPWGIFFVKFEPKKLPVVALRRILSQVALKKRASANSAERAAWAADDLLFVSNYGEGDERQISFAHFSKAADGHDLPTLKVLGWDNLDTALHLDDVAEKLTTNLAWPKKEDPEAWREQWRAAFTLRHREVVTTSKELSIRLAELARAIRDRIKTALAIETDRGPLTKLMKAFQEALIHDLDADGFADMYAQTIAYGLLSARIADPHKKTADDFAGHMRTNPFLRELMETFLKVGGRRGKAGGPGIDFDELGVSEVMDLLDDANMEAVVLDFGDRNPQEDPVIHFYELFLKEYDAKKRMQRGVFYTPRPVVSYIVRSVHELLQTEFGLADGLADTTTWGEMAKRHAGLTIPEGVKSTDRFVTVLDPATGTGTFLVEAIEVIHRTLVEQWKHEGHGETKIDALWNDYVPKHLLPRLHGYELLMAPYAIAHLKIGLKLYETGYRFGSEERARIYLTNSLEPPTDDKKQREFEELAPALAHEAKAVNAVKRHQGFTVVIGNPPYSISSQNSGPWITHLVDSYKTAVRHEQNIQPLSDDYVKFFRFGQHTIETSRFGILSYISNHTFLSGLIHRGMREEMCHALRHLSILDLNGSALLGLQTPEGKLDQNVFDIQQGVGITFGWTIPTRPETSTQTEVRFFSLWGDRASKYAFLAANTRSQIANCTLKPAPPNYFFVPMAERDATYDSWASLADIFVKQSTGLETGRDEVLISFDRAEIHSFCLDLHAENFSITQLAEKYSIKDTSGWPVSARRNEVQSSALSSLLSSIRLVKYRPFDKRFTIYGNFLRRAQFENMRHMLTPNLGLVASRMIKGENPAHFYAARDPIEKILISPKTSNNAFLFPLYLSEDESTEAGTLLLPRERETNFNRAFLGRLSNSLGLQQVRVSGLPAGLTPEDIFHYAYAVFHSPGYRSHYAEFLKIDFPRLPLTGNLELFRALARLGGELVSLHLLESPKLDKSITEFIVGRNPEVEKVSWSKSTVWMDKAQTTGFKGVREDVWNFHIGGYQVCEKWLKDRKGRTLSKDDIVHYQKIVVALNETIRLMKEIDDVIEQHGGWPGAFQTGEAKPVQSQERLL